jgi:hypothetical protein
VQLPRSLADGKLEVRTPSGGAVEVVVSTQRIGGYVFWTKARLQPAADRFAAIVVLAEGDAPDMYLVPTTEWSDASPPFTDRDNAGKRTRGSTRCGAQLSVPRSGMTVGHERNPS